MIRWPKTIHMVLPEPGFRSSVLPNVLHSTRSVARYAFLDACRSGSNHIVDRIITSDDKMTREYSHGAPRAGISIKCAAERVALNTFRKWINLDPFSRNINSRSIHLLFYRSHATIPANRAIQNWSSWLCSELIKPNAFWPNTFSRSAVFRLGIEARLRDVF